MAATAGMQGGLDAASIGLAHPGPPCMHRAVDLRTITGVTPVMLAMLD